MTMDREQQQVEVRVRALIGNFEGEPIFMGAMSFEAWELHDLPEAEEWADNLRSEFDITETREVDVTLSVPADLFSTPQLSATAQEAKND